MATLRKCISIFRREKGREKMKGGAGGRGGGEREVGGGEGGG